MKKHHVVFIIFFILLLIKHSFLYLQFDDYAYGSLSYSYILEGIEGTNYNIIDIIKFCIGHYFSWGGRVLCYFIEALLLKLGLPVLRIVQSIIITSIFYLIYLITKKEDNIKHALFVVALYGIIDIMIVSSGIMWIAASTSYIFPLLPLLLYIYLDKENKGPTWVRLILLFLSSLSQEQIGICAFIYPVIKYLKTRDKKEIKYILIALVGYAILMLAPGNFVRIDDASNFYDLSLIQKLKIQGTNIIENIFYNRNTYFIKLLIISTVIINHKNPLIKALNVVYLIFEFILPNGYYMALVNNNLEIIFYIHLIAIIITNLNHLFIVAIMSQIIMMIAPYYPSRSIIPFMFIYFIIIVKNIKENKYFNYILYPVCLVAIINFTYITYGYYQNSEIHKYNHNKLKEAQKQNLKSADLKKLKNNMFANTQPYEDPDLIYPYMRQYYNLDENFIFNYK